MKYRTFQLTTSRRGRQNETEIRKIRSKISTHDLTKRSTLKMIRLSDYRTDFNSRPHEEVDNQIDYPSDGETISTHDLTKRSTGTEVLPDMDEAFQLTTSRRGRRFCLNIRRPRIFHFNSRPHEEVDYDITFYRRTRIQFQLTTSRRGRRTSASMATAAMAISTHDLTKRSTIAAAIMIKHTTTFQLTTSRRGRRKDRSRH